MKSRHAWLQAMHTLISSARPSRALLANSGSASIGRAIDTRSASPAARIASATSGVLMRFDAMTGILTASLSRRAANAQAARGTFCAIVGTRASCQPIPWLMMSAPAASTAFASATISSAVSPPCTRSMEETRNTIRKSRPTLARTAFVVSTASRSRFSRLPPQPSVRSLLRGAVNSLMR